MNLPFPFDRRWPIAEAVELACLLEASSPKVGNVHPGASFSDMHLSHFLASAITVGPILAQANKLSIGQLVLAGVQATRTSVERNTNLGTLLLLAPLAKAYSKCSENSDKLCSTQITLDSLSECVATVLEQLTADDCQAVYAAIRIAQPGGLGARDQDDVAGNAPLDLRLAMRSVAEVDAVARQYVNNFSDILTLLAPWLNHELISTGQPLEAILRVQLHWLSREADGLIVRKAGLHIASQVQQRAAWFVQTFRLEKAPTESPRTITVNPRSPTQVPSLQSHSLPSFPTPLAAHPQLQELDQFLRADGHRRNPGTTADLIAAALFVLLVAPPAV